jgi:hypothetical protein
MSTAGVRCCSLALAAQVNHLQNLQTWLETIVIDLTVITASAICNNGMELVTETQRPTSQYRSPSYNRLDDAGNSERYLQQKRGIALEETTSNAAGIARRHSLGERCVQQ